MTLEIASLAMGLREGFGENAASERLHAMAREHLRYVWRLLRRVGLSERDADDVTQKVFLIAAEARRDSAQ